MYKDASQNGSYPQLINGAFNVMMSTEAGRNPTLTLATEESQATKEDVECMLNDSIRTMIPQDLQQLTRDALKFVLLPRPPQDEKKKTDRISVSKHTSNLATTLTYQVARGRLSTPEQITNWLHQQSLKKRDERKDKPTNRLLTLIDKSIHYLGKQNPEMKNIKKTNR
jgi:hypothetical protein